MRHLRRALISLPLGALATYLVAAAAALRSVPQPVPALPAAPPSAPARVTDFRAFGLTATPQSPIDIPPAGGLSPTTAAFTVSAGWPFRAFVATTSPRARAPFGGFAPSQLPFPSLAARPVTTPCFVPRVLPSTPMWPGLLTDSVLWGCLAYAGLSAIARWRRSVRLRRGQCPECLYRLASPSNRCPECGTVVRVG